MPRLLATLLVSALAALSASTALASSTLQPYRSEVELNAALERWREGARRHRAERDPVAADSAMAPAPATALAQSKVADESSRAEGITNVQTAGVDEGGIVKRAGDHLVILRRGRLFTVRVGGDQLRPVSQIDAYAPASDPRGAWYDELLISGSTVVVIGFSASRGGTEIGLFELGTDGTLAYRATYHLRSFDYYSARNYASRLIGQRLVFYAPTLLQPWGPPWTHHLPAWRRWRGQAAAEDFERLLPATRIYRTDDDFDSHQPLALHTVTSCELGAAALRCEASAVLGPAGRVFYVSAGSVYVWTSSGHRRAPGSRDEAPPSAVFRLPLDGSAPSALKTSGVPTDQFSFLEDSQGFLNVLLREHGVGEGMWGSARSAGRTALLRVPLDAFGDGRQAAALEHYRRLPGPEQGGLHNRFVGDWLLWGAGPQAWALRYADADVAVALQPAHRVERIEALGRHAVLVGNAGVELRFSAVRLQRDRARIEGGLGQAGARQGESRSHGFFYRATGDDDGLLGLPILGAESRRRGDPWPAAGQGAAVLVLRQRGLSFTALGQLDAHAGATGADGCKASCTDWYGNARPLFLGQRVLALMGYELVEGRLQGWGRAERLVERRRVDFSPAPRPSLRARPTPFD